MMGGLPTTGVFLRTGANIKAGATHRTSGIITAIATGFIALLVLPFFSYIPMVVIAAILVNTALGLLGLEELKHYWHRERESFGVAILVALVTIFHDAGLAVGVGAIVALLLFARKISHGNFDITWNFADGSTDKIRGAKTLDISNRDKAVLFVTYSVAGDIGYIDASRHYQNIKKLTRDVTPIVIIRLRDLFSIDLEGSEALADAVMELRTGGVKVIMSSVSEEVKSDLQVFPVFVVMETERLFTEKTSDAMDLCY
jgi:MFS superfamily sulfate permease-like transporter